MATLQSLLVAMHSTQESWRFHDITTIIVQPLCVYSNSRETSKFVVDGGVTRNSTKMMGSSARIALALPYLIAYVFAGKVNKVGRILSSEKDA
jgi:hypothetical protein